MASETLPHLSHWGAFRVTVDDGRIVDVAAHPDDPTPSPLLRNYLDGIDHPTRVARPALRRGWLEHGPGPTDRRGADDFVEVPWDEALDRLAAELRRVREEHGNEAIFGGSYGWASAGRFHHAQSQIHRFLNRIGGYTASVNSYSTGASEVLLPRVVGSATQVFYRATTWKAILDHTDLVVAFGGMNPKNTFVSPGGITRHTLVPHLEEAARRGLEFHLFSPLRDDLPPVVRSQWYPVVPATDVAVMLGLAHVLLTEDLADHDFLDRYTVGADRLIAYVLGEEDGQAKTPEWAESVSGIAADDLRDLARRMAAGRTLVTVSYGLQRTEHGEQVPWMAIALAALLGQIGLPGGGFGHGFGSMGDHGNPVYRFPLPSLPQGRNPVATYIPVAQIVHLLEHPGETLAYNGEELALPDIRLVYWAGGNPFHHHQDLNRLRRALGRLDTLVVHDPYWTATARHADIVLPVTTTLERNDIGAGRNDGYVFAMKRAIDPVGEARDDYEIFADLSKRLDVWDDFTEGRSADEWLAHLWADFERRTTERTEVRIPDFEAFWADGELQLPPTSDRHTLFDEFRADPEAHPLRTPSGRIELHSATIAAFGYDDCPGHPTWIEPDEWLGSERAREFPLHLIANQPSTRLHSQLDGGRHSQDGKVAGKEPVRIHPDDAAARGISDGDVVRLVNDRGACLAGAVVSDAVRPGVVQLSTGAWFDPDPEGTCRNGNPNAVTRDQGTSRLAQGSTGQHCLVQADPWTESPPGGG